MEFRKNKAGKSHPLTQPGSPDIATFNSLASQDKSRMPKPAKIVYYRGTVPGSTKKISTGYHEWDDNLFVSKDIEQARAYGQSIETIIPKPEAKIIAEGTREWNLKGMPRWKRSESMLEYGIRVVRKARELGYDIVEFKSQGNVGTVILNRDAVIRNVSM